MKFEGRSFSNFEFVRDDRGISTMSDAFSSFPERSCAAAASLACIDAPSSSSAEEAILRLESELREAHAALREKEAKCNQLSAIQNSVDTEVQELTEKLFQEAYKMVNMAEEKRERAEKLLAEARLKVDVLTAEVEALKVLVKSPGMGANHHNLTSPTRSNSPFGLKFLNSSSKKSSSSAVNGTPKSKSASLPSTSALSTLTPSTVDEEQKRADEVEEIDPICYREFTAWRESGHSLDESHAFLARVFAEDVRPCMQFENRQLADRILVAIRGNTLELEPIQEDRPEIKMCTLSNVPRFCPYRVRVSPEAEWVHVSLLARNRIAAVCDFFTFVRYLALGLVKAGVRDTFWDVVALRKNMALAKLGLGFVPKTSGARRN